MEFIVLDEGFKKKPIATFYRDKNFGGDEQELGSGLYNKQQFTIGEPRSVKLAPNVSFMAFERSDGTGRNITVTKDLPDIAEAMPFAPALFALTCNVGAYSGETLAATLSPGGYDTALLREKSIDRIEVPEGLIVRFANGDGEEGAKSFNEGEVAVGGDLLEFSNMHVLHVQNNADLSDAELAMVAGGKGAGAKACAARACAAEMGIVDACPAKACAVNVLPVMPVSP
jgi:hypothetical protein